MAKRHVDSLKAKQRKQKILVAVLGVVFLGVAAFQGPKLWKQLHPPADVQRDYTQTTTTSAPPGTPTLAAPTLGSGSQSPAPTAPAGGSLASAPVPVLADGQLTSFSRFASKDPFSQQLSEKGSGTSGSSSPSPDGSTSSSGGGTTPSGGGGASAPTPGTAVISVNGTLYTVSVGNDFPEASSSDPSLV